MCYEIKVLYIQISYNGDLYFMSNVVYIFESSFEGLYFSGLLGLQERDLNI